jgi:SAM-dependent methyltransferase
VAKPQVAWIGVTACRACGSSDLVDVLDLGRTPLANALLPAICGEAGGETYPLNVVRCATCTLLQLREIVPPETLFSQYAYFSSVSDALVQHAAELADAVAAAEPLGPSSLVIEIASNDGYLLKAFKARGIPVLGIEPAGNIAQVAQEAGIPTRRAFFGLPLARELRAEGTTADVLLGNNVLAHVPELNAFAAAVATVLKPTGTAMFEFPYVKDMLDEVEFDTIYHEHQCYFSLTALSRLFQAHGLQVHDAESIRIHGGSLRLSLSHVGRREVHDRVARLLAEEQAWGVDQDAPYRRFAASVEQVKARLLELLDSLRREQKRIVAYGAAAKGVTLTSYCGIGAAHLEYVVDRSPYKQGFRFPVDGLPIYATERLAEDHPDYALLLTWNFADEILRQQAPYVAAGGRFVVPVPVPRIVEP